MGYVINPIHLSILDIAIGLISYISLKLRRLAFLIQFLLFSLTTNTSRCFIIHTRLELGAGCQNKPRKITMSVKYNKINTKGKIWRQ